MIEDTLRDENIGVDFTYIVCADGISVRRRPSKGRGEAAS